MIREQYQGRLHWDASVVSLEDEESRSGFEEEEAATIEEEEEEEEEEAATNEEEEEEEEEEGNEIKEKKTSDAKGEEDEWLVNWEVRVAQEGRPRRSENEVAL